MKKIRLFLLLVIAACLTCPLAGQTVDLSGTWFGSTAVPNAEEKDQITLVLKKEGNSYTGTVTDSMGMLNQTPLKEVKLEKGALSFYFMVFTGESELRVDSTLKISDGKLSGTWSSAAGDSGSYEFERKK